MEPIRSYIYVATLKGIYVRRCLKNHHKFLIFDEVCSCALTYIDFHKKLRRAFSTACLFKRERERGSYFDLFMKPSINIEAHINTHIPILVIYKKIGLLV